MLSCTKLTKKVCTDQTHCGWIVKKGCRKNSEHEAKEQNNVDLISKSYITNNIKTDKGASYVLTLGGFKALSDTIYQFCRCIFAQELNVYDSSDLRPLNYYRGNTDGYVEYVQEGKKYIKSPNSTEDDFKIGKIIERAFNIIIKDDESTLFFIGGLKYIIEEILYHAITFTKKNINADSIARSIQRSIFIELTLIYMSKEDMVRKQNEMLLRFQFSKRPDGQNVFGYLYPETPPYNPSPSNINIPTNLYKCKLSDVLKLAKNYKLKKLSGLDKKTLIKLLLPLVPIPILNDTNEQKN